MPSDSDSDTGDGIMSIVLSKKRFDETVKKKVKQQFTILELDNLQERENPAGWKENYFALDRKALVLQVELSLKQKNDVERDEKKKAYNR